MRACSTGYRPSLWILICLALLSPLAKADDLTITEILNNQDFYDGKVAAVIGTPYVSYKGAFLHDEQGHDLWLVILPSCTDTSNIQEDYGRPCRVQGTFYRTRAIPDCSFAPPEGVIGITAITPLNQGTGRNRLGYRLDATLQVGKGMKAILTDFRSGQGYIVETGTSCRGLFNKKIVSILRDRVIVEEECPQCSPEKTRRFEVQLRK